MEEQSEDTIWAQLATRIPKSLHTKMKLHCVRADISVMGFVMSALEEKLAERSRTPAVGRRKPPYGRNARLRWPIGTLTRRERLRR
jgi:hypothetical protein